MYCSVKNKHKKIKSTIERKCKVLLNASIKGTNTCNGIRYLPAVVKKLGYKGITQSILVARTSVMSQNGSKCYFRSFPMLG